MTEEELINEARNLSGQEILEMEELLKEGIRQYLKRFLLGTSEAHPWEGNIVMSTGAQGLNDSEKVCVVKMYQFQDWVFIQIDYDNNFYELNFFDLQFRCDLVFEIEHGNFTNSKTLSHDHTNNL